MVIGCIDSNSLVAGKGIERLKKAGIKVTVGILEDECRTHHKRFFTVQEQKRPYIILKWAATVDGFIAPLKKENQAPVWISNKYSQQLVHKLRCQEQAILVGTNTVIADNPRLTVRSWTGNNPTRIVLDRALRVSEKAHVYDNNVATIFIIDEGCKKIKTSKNNQNIIFESIDYQKNIAAQICAILQKHDIQSLIIEGGTKTLQTFIDANLWDEAHVFTGDVLFKKGVKAPVFSAPVKTTMKIKNDLLNIYKND